MQNAKHTSDVMLIPCEWGFTLSRKQKKYIPQKPQTVPLMSVSLCSYQIAVCEAENLQRECWEANCTKTNKIKHIIHHICLIHFT